MSEVEKEENLVKKTCRELGITQKELAEMIGVSPKTVSDWTVGRLQITTPINKLLKLLIKDKNCNVLLNSINLVIAKNKEII